MENLHIIKQNETSSRPEGPLGLGVPHAFVLRPFFKLMQDPNDFLRAKAHRDKYHLAQAKSGH
jgi:hypothetical protein